MPGPTLITQTVPGWYGKLPNLGDFASRRLPEPFVRRWDRWLQRGLASARAQLGERWLDTYLVAPILRFWVAPGLLGVSGWTGLMMPSVDRVGRHFPLTIAQPGVPLAAALASPAWFARLDAALRQVLDVEFSVDDLERTLAALPALDAPVADAAAERLADAARQHGGAAGPGSVWWREDLGAPPRCFTALPPAPAFASLIGGAR